jgi:hypothetical protein
MLTHCNKSYTEATTVEPAKSYFDRFGRLRHIYLRQALDASISAVMCHNKFGQ